MNPGPDNKRAYHVWQVNGLSDKPLVIQRSTASRWKWFVATIAALPVILLCAVITHFMIWVVVPYQPPVLLGSVQFGIAATWLVALLIGLIGLFLLAYMVISLEVLFREIRNGLITLSADGMSTPCYFNQPIPWSQIRAAVVIEDRPIPGMVVAYPFFVIDDRKELDSGMSLWQRFGAMIYGGYSQWFGSRYHGISDAIKLHKGCRVVSILTDPATISAEELVMIARKQADL